MNNPKTEELVKIARGCASNDMRACYICEYGKYSPCNAALLAAVADSLEELERALSRLGQFGKLFLDYDGCHRGARGRMGNATLIDEALSMEPITDVDGNKWIPVQEEVLRELSEAVQQRWIPVTESTPKEDEQVYAYWRGDVFSAYYYPPIGFVSNETGHVLYDVTHWAPRPELPKEDENESNPD